ncbi:MAG TPA: hypothetical protein VMR33_07550 [Candidatus Baltobacteraceae bacterium]|jgi:hypothetical protein|nr:hypothetical protein [Candidatus Baltobacteraceae bacterium]
MTSASSQIPQKPEWAQRNYKDIVRSRHCFIESLPLPLVHYPECYGTWILFQEFEGAQPVLCDCQLESALRFLRINAQNEVYRLARGYTLVDHFIPSSLRTVNHLKASTREEFAALPFFKAKVCHICNRRVPSIRWSNNDGCSIFRQHLGWYFHHALLAAGVSPFGFLLAGELDSELAALVEVDPAEGYVRVRELLATQPSLSGTPAHSHSLVPKYSQDREEAHTLSQTLNRQNCRIRRLIEERLRRTLGFPPHGKTGVSEVLLRWIVSALFPGQELIFRSRPEFLRGLELDIYIPGLSLGIEYQGEQHYEPFDHLGGERHLQGVISRDNRKAYLCKRAGVDLKYFTVADKLTEDFVKERLFS